jgi:hypothetical protein
VQSRAPVSRRRKTVINLCKEEIATFGEGHMGKIPVGKTVAYAYSFAFGNILNILGVAWFPFLIIGVGGYFLMMPYIAAVQQFLTTQDVSSLGSTFLLLPVFVILVVVCMSMVTVEVVREALGMDPGRKFFYFSLDKPVWRLIGAYLLLMLILIGLGIAGAIVLGILVWLAAMADANAALLVSSVGGVILVLAMFLIAVRLVFLLPAVVVAENHISLKRGYHLTYGNFWRIVGVVLAIVIPLALVQSAVQMAVFGSDFMAMNIMPSDSPEEMAAKLQVLQTQLQSGLLIMVPIWIVVSIVNLGLTAGAGAFAYRALTGTKAG